MKRFVDSMACRSRAHCPVCRDREGGRKMRTAWGRRFLLPDDKVDFDCPFGGGWGASPSKGLGDTVSKLIDMIFFGKIKECGGCRKRRAALNKRFPYTKKG